MPRLFKPVANTVLKGVLWCVAILPVGVAVATTTFSHSQYNQHTEEPIHQEVPFSHRHHALELGIDCRYCHTSVEKSSFAGIPPTKTCMSCHSLVWTNSDLLAPVRESWAKRTPLVWKRVNDLPEFVYFNHSIHVARGVQCNVCHGPVQEMPLTWKSRNFTMIWCLNCHRNTEKFLARTDPSVSPREQVFNLYWKIQQGQTLSPLEQAYARGDDMPDNGDHASGRRLVNNYGVRTRQLADCTVCHR